MRKAQITLAVIAVVILTGFTALAIHSGVGASGRLNNISTPKLQSSADKLKSINVQYEKLNVQLNNKSTTDQKTIDNLKAQQQKLNQEKSDLEKQVQAKADEKAKLQVAAANAANTLTATGTANAESLPVLPTGSHQDWMAAAGIDPSNYGYVDYIVSHESGWNPSAVNASSGACGLGQQLPCGKWAGTWNDPIAALAAMNVYVGKYGGWYGAYSYWVSHGNY